MASKTRNRFDLIRFLNHLDSEIPAVEDQKIVAVSDNLSTRGTQEVTDWLKDHPRWSFQFTPTHASWLNQVEIFFSILHRRLLKHGTFTSEDDLAEQMLAFIETYNQGGPTSISCIAPQQRAHHHFFFFFRWFFLRTWRTALAQPVAVIFVDVWITAPFCPRNAVGIASFDLHRLPFAASAENLPCGSVSSKVPTGTSGTVLNVLLVIPAFEMNVEPTRWTVTP
jgi:hypothetical protein